MASASQTPASVHGVSQPRPASILPPTSQNTLLESAGTGMTGKNTFIMPNFRFYLVIINELEPKHSYSLNT